MNCGHAITVGGSVYLCDIKSHVPGVWHRVVTPAMLLRWETGHPADIPPDDFDDLDELEDGQ